MINSQLPANFAFRPDPASAEPIYLQLAAALSEAIRSGRIAIGMRLPSERHFAQVVGVSRTTVTSAYQEIKALGLLRGYVGRGAIVIADDPERAVAGAIAWPQRAARRAPAPLSVSTAISPGDISFSDGWLYPSLVPHSVLAASAARVAQQPHALSRAAPLLGLAVLRDALIENLRVRGVKATSSEVLITSGAQQGLNVIARALISPGDTVVCENPTWYGATRAFRAAGAEVVGVGMDHEGIDPDALEDALIRTRAKFVYLIPSFQCPTGRLLGLARRRRILDLCARLRTPIVESHVYGDIAFGERVPSLKSLDTAGIVIHQGSASKTISPALRLGWLVAPQPAVDLFAPAKASLDLSTPTLTQAALADFLGSRAYARHQVEFRNELRDRRNALIAALARHCPELRYARPEGGLYLWAQLPNRLQAREFETAATSAGVSVRSGDAFMTNGAASSHIRLCFAAPAPDEINAGAQRLGKALRAALLQHRQSGAAGTAFAAV
jgi:DNA-binding transcriptional MocR family regulator